MRNLVLAGSLILLILASLARVSQSASAQQGMQTPTPTIMARSGTQGPMSSRSPSSLTAKSLSNPYCYQPEPAVDQCFLNVRSYYATDNQTTSPYMSAINLTINNKMRLRENLFFEGTTYYNYAMAPNGFKVPCGAPNAGGGGMAFGNSYYLRIEPIDNTGASMGFDQAFVYCPAFSP